MHTQKSVNTANTSVDLAKTGFGMRSLYRTLRLAKSQALEAVETTAAGDRSVVIVGETHLQHLTINQELWRMLNSRSFSILGLENFCRTPLGLKRMSLKVEMMQQPKSLTKILRKIKEH